MEDEMLKKRGHCPEDQLRAAERVEEQEEEKLVVLKADAIVNPRAMMIHL